MIKNKIYYILVSIIFVLSACTKEDNNTPVSTGGLTVLTSTSVSYVVGEAEKRYTVELGIKQGGNFTKSIEIKSTFYSKNAAGDVIKSNEVTLKTITIDNKADHFIDFDMDYTELIANLTLEGSPLPTSDGGLKIGDYWQLKVLSTTENGNVYETAKKVNVGVGTRFAGTYKVVEATYIRAGVQRDDVTDSWIGKSVVISSVDATTYKYEEWGMLAGWAGNTLYFKIDPATNAITYPEKWDDVAQDLNDGGLATPIRNPNDLTEAIALAGANINKSIKDDVEGKDRLNMVHGYITDAPRQFYFLLEKIIE